MRPRSGDLWEDRDSFPRTLGSARLNLWWEPGYLGEAIVYIGGGLLLLILIIIVLVMVLR